MIVKVNNCARCSENHDLNFIEFSKNPIEDSDGTIWNYWAICPNTNEPILLKVINDKELGEPSP